MWRVYTVREDSVVSQRGQSKYTVIKGRAVCVCACKNAVKHIFKCATAYINDPIYYSRQVYHAPYAARG